MPSLAVADPRAWTADTVDGSEQWYAHLSGVALAALRGVIAAGRRAGRETTALRVTDECRAVCREEIEPVRAALEQGRGFVVITSGTTERLPPDDLTALYWLVGQLLGEPFEQNVQGTLLYDVRDTGQDVRYGARFSVTNAESTFHTDNSFGDTVLDYVGLLCLNTARSGGLSQLVSGFAVADELRRRYPEQLDLLCRPFHVDRRGGVLPGQEPTARVPVFGGAGSELLVRYLRYWVEVGHEKARLPLTAEQVAALDTLDAVAAEPRLRVEFALRPGEMFFINNRWLLHNRTAFDDHPEPDRKRHYVRLWLRKATET